MSHKSSWGGSWTEEKLDAFEKYVRAYLTIMNCYRDRYKHSWELIYVDAFAGSGERQEEVSVSPLFALAGIQEIETRVYQGAAERVLRLDMRGFNFYYFIDLNEIALAALEERLTLLAPEKSKLIFRVGNANNQIKNLAKALRENKLRKALVLLDPFGMQIDWSSVESLHNTGTDLWILIPSGVIINRLLDKNGELTRIAKLESFFGATEAQIRALFYESAPGSSLVVW
jgi:three-Cys-motif partner protein